LKTAILYTPLFLEHRPGRRHPESPKRLEAIMAYVRRSGILNSESCVLVEPKRQSLEDVLLVHDEEYVRFIERRCRMGGSPVDMGDTFVSPRSFDVAVRAVGASITAVDMVLEGSCRNAFVLCRPPGHHAGVDYACGFCLFNNVASATMHLLRRRGLRRVLIVDLDAHHGNGTQEIFYRTGDVLYVSLHQNPQTFPGAGFSWQVGEGDGEGYTVNIPLPQSTGDTVYLTALEWIVEPIAKQYRPEFILASVGLDVHHRDPIGRLGLTAWGQLAAIKKVLRLAEELCSGRFVAVLEGGYNLKFVAMMVTADISAMAGLTPKLWDTQPLNLHAIKAKGWKVLKEVRKIQSAYWSL